MTITRITIIILVVVLIFGGYLAYSLLKVRKAQSVCFDYTDAVRRSMRKGCLLSYPFLR